jgi:hypothetical protein
MLGLQLVSESTEAVANIQVLGVNCPGIPGSRGCSAVRPPRACRQLGPYGGRES